MINTYNYIYIRTHNSYEKYNACKLGKTDNIPERDSQYITSEIERGNFEYVYEVQQANIIEKLLQTEFSKYNIKYNGGTEFFDKQIIPLIEPCFGKNNIKYRKLSKEEINKLVRPNRVKNILKKINIKSLIKYLKKYKTNDKIIKYKPRPDQEIIIEKSIKYFEKNDKGMLILVCGVGKTLLSLWITQKLNYKTILIGVPNKLLLKQWENVISNIFQNFPYMIISGGVEIESIETFLQKNKNKYIIITTYASAHKVYKATKNKCMFKIKINDECHHLTTNNMKLANNTKKYVQMLNIKSNKQLSLTATLKNLESDTNDDNIVSNNNIEYFGEIIDGKSLLWAIENNIVCDYEIHTFVKTNIDEIKLEEILTQFNIVEENDKRLFLSSYISLLNIYEKHSHHLLIYSNNKDNSLKLIKYIEMLLKNKYFEIPNLYFSNYHSEMKSKDQKEIINNFDNSSNGIISCVYCLGEGWDFPLLDAVVFSENMSSNIRIVQSALRASRKNNNDINKITKIILPILNKNNWFENNDNQDFQKVNEVIYQLGLEDETIIQKIKVFNIEIKKNQAYNKNNKFIKVNKLTDKYNEKLTEMLKLKITKRSSLNITYERAKKIIAEKNIKSKESYYQLCDKDNRLSKDPEIVFKGKFINWIDYLSIKRKYYDLDTCKNKVNEYLFLNPNIKKKYLNLSDISYELCKIDELFPPNGLWVEYYNVKDLKHIIKITNNKKQPSMIV
jgi:superfamily II DNA or RNA helicase